MSSSVVGVSSSASSHKTSSTDLSKAFVTQHLWNDLCTISEDTSFHAAEIHWTILDAGAFLILPHYVNGRLSERSHFSFSLRTRPLNGLFTETSNGWSWDVIPLSIRTRVVLESFNFRFTKSVVWPLKVSNSSILLDKHRGPDRRFPIIFNQFIMRYWVIQVLFWAFTITSREKLSSLILSFDLILCKEEAYCHQPFQFFRISK